MAPFEQIRSGIDGMDSILDHIRLGDNVVWQVASLDEYRFFTEPFVRQAISDGRNVIYFRFSDSAPVLKDTTGVKVFLLDPAEGFERFTVSVHSMITQEGRGAFYVFDSLSDLQTAWSTDLMMGNFFRVICPYLFELDTVAYFPLLRSHHGFDAVARIRETTQLFLDVYSPSEPDSGLCYLHPLKVWNRYSHEMFLPHRVSADGTCSALTDGVDISMFYTLLHARSPLETRQNLDSYEQFFDQAKTEFLGGTFSEASARKIIRTMLTVDPKLSSLILKHFEPKEYFLIKGRMIGSGVIGGKSCGMLLARKLTEKFLPQYQRNMEPHDSFFIGTDVFYSYLVDNGLWKLRIEQTTDSSYFSAGEKIRAAILGGIFSERVRSQLRQMLEYFGQNPIIVRSSSFLEDGFGSAFAGKYASIFCANAGSPEDRLAALELAIRQVYASTVDRSALEYRRTRGLDRKDEQMAILVQRVSGTRFGDCFFPCAAGIGFSYSLYRFSNEIDPTAGMLRLVAGLGTRAVDRTGGDYPRIVNLDKPEYTTLFNAERRHLFSQKTLDLITISQNRFCSLKASDLFPELPDWYKRLVAEHDREAESRFRQRGEQREILFISCAELVKNEEFIRLMRDILHTLEREYGTPVDIEYTVNFNQEGFFVMNLLQCRPLSVWKAADAVSIPDPDENDILFRVKQTFMGNFARKKIDAVVWIDSAQYFSFPYAKKSLVAGAIDRINTYYKGKGKTLMLFAPGRIGTSSPELGVPVRFSNISGFSLICEYSDADSGYLPELSYGSHMFQDMVEANIFYAALFDDETTQQFNRAFWTGRPDLFPVLFPTQDAMFDMVQVYETDRMGLTMYADIKSQTALCCKEK